MVAFLQVRYNMHKQVRIQENFDRKVNGRWVRSWNETIVQNFYHTHFTLSGSRWAEMLRRCNPESVNNKRFPRYVGCTNGFRDFQDFVEWSRSEYGYDLTNLIDGKHRMWHLEKDIILAGNKIYSPDTCLFVPQEVNALFTTSPVRRGDYPIGVSWNAKGRVLECYTRTKEGRKYMGCGQDPMELHKIWQLEKIKYLRFIADKYIAHKRLYVALNNRADIIQKDVDNKVESLFE